MLLEQRKSIITVLGMAIALIGLGFTAGTFFRHPASAPTFIVLDGDRINS